MFNATITTRSDQSHVTHKKIVFHLHLKSIYSHSRSQRTHTKIHPSKCLRMPPKIILILNVTSLKNTDKNCAASFQTPLLTINIINNQRPFIHMDCLNLLKSLYSQSQSRLGILYVFLLLKFRHNMKWHLDWAWLQVRTKTKSWKVSERNIRIIWITNISKECRHHRLMNGTQTKTTTHKPQTLSKVVIIINFKVAQETKV